MIKMWCKFSFNRHGEDSGLCLGPLVYLRLPDGDCGTRCGL